MLWNKYTVRVSGVVSVEGDGLPADYRATFNNLKHRLETPRRAIKYTVGGTTLLAWEPGDGAPDAGMGPDPEPATVTRMNEGVFFVEVGYVVCLLDCGEQAAENPVVSLRWEQRESYDQNWYTQLRTSGLLIVRADLKKSADSFRALATPPVLKDFRRHSAEYVLSKSGTELSFNFTDVEEYLLPPRPATKAGGRFTCTVTAGSIRNGQCDVHLEGPKGVNRRDLMMVAIRMAFAKLNSEGLAGGSHRQRAVLGESVRVRGGRVAPG